MQIKNTVAFVANNGLSFLAGERFIVLAEGEVSTWLQHATTGSRLFIGCVFFQLHTVSA